MHSYKIAAGGMKLRSKFLLSYLLGNLLVVTFGVSALLNMVNRETAKTYDEISLQFNEALVTFSDSFNHSYTVLDNLLTGYFLQRLENDYRSAGSYIANYFDYIRDLVTQQNILLEGDLRVSIYVDNPTIVYEQRILHPLNAAVVEQPWYAALEAGRGALTLCGTTDAGGEAAIVLGRCLGKVNRKYAVVMQITIPYSIFADICAAADLGEDVYLVAQDGTILFATEVCFTLPLAIPDRNGYPARPSNN